MVQTNRIEPDEQTHTIVFTTAGFDPIYKKHGAVCHTLLPPSATREIECVNLEINK